MSYLTDADIESILSDARLAEFTAESGSTADSAVVAAIRADVDDLINSALAGSYAVPVTSTVDLASIRPHAKVLFKWACLMRRDLSPDEATRMAYESTDALLTAWRTGKARLSPSAAPAAVPPSTSTTTTGSSLYGSDDPIASGIAGYM